MLARAVTLLSLLARTRPLARHAGDSVGSADCLGAVVADGARREQARSEARGLHPTRGTQGAVSMVRDHDDGAAGARIGRREAQTYCWGLPTRRPWRSFLGVRVQPRGPEKMQRNVREIPPWAPGLGLLRAQGAGWCGSRAATTQGVRRARNSRDARRGVLGGCELLHEEAEVRTCGRKALLAQRGALRVYSTRQPWRRGSLESAQGRTRVLSRPAG